MSRAIIILYPPDSIELAKAIEDGIQQVETLSVKRLAFTKETVQTTVDNSPNTGAVLIVLFSPGFFAIDRDIRLLSQIRTPMSLGYIRYVPVQARASVYNKTLYGAFVSFPVAGDNDISLESLLPQDRKAKLSVLAKIIIAYSLEKGELK